MLRTTGGRVLVTPDAAASETDAGLILPESARRDPPMSGRVVAVGSGPASAHTVRRATIRKCLACVDDLILDDEMTAADAMAEIRAALTRYAEAVEALPSVTTGDRVVFPYTAGTALTVDGEPYIVLNEDQIEAVWTQEDAHE